MPSVQTTIKGNKENAEKETVKEVRIENVAYFCPNRECQNKKVLFANGICPKCGAKATLFESAAATELLDAKTGLDAKLLFSDKTTDHDIRIKIYEDMRNLAAHEAGTSWMRLGTLLSGNTTDQILGAGLKAIIDQNKIQIRQNELILRV